MIFNEEAGLKKSKKVWLIDCHPFSAINLIAFSRKKDLFELFEVFAAELLNE